MRWEPLRREGQIQRFCIGYLFREWHAQGDNVWPCGCVWPRIRRYPDSGYWTSGAKPVSGSSTPTARELRCISIYGGDADIISALKVVIDVLLAGHFQELSFYEIVYPDDAGQLFDSVLGLAYEEPFYKDPEAPSLLQSPFRNLVDSAILDSNVFSILLPTKDRGGDIMFGGYNESFLAGDLVKHPCSPQTPQSGRWKASSFQCAGRTNPEALGRCSMNPSLDIRSCS